MKTLIFTIFIKYKQRENPDVSTQNFQVYVTLSCGLSLELYIQLHLKWIGKFRHSQPYQNVKECVMLLCIG